MRIKDKKSKRQGVEYQQVPGSNRELDRVT